MKTLYQLYDPIQRRVIGTYQCANRAHTRRDQLDNAHGSYRYRVVPVAVRDTNGGYAESVRS